MCKLILTNIWNFFLTLAVFFTKLEYTGTRVLEKNKIEYSSIWTSSSMESLLGVSWFAHNRMSTFLTFSSFFKWRNKVNVSASIFAVDLRINDPYLNSLFSYIYSLTHAHTHIERTSEGQRQRHKPFLSLSLSLHPQIQNKHSSSCSQLQLK
jgi:hypothetical protein